MRDLEVLQQLHVKDNIIKLPLRQVDYETRLALERRMSRIGGKWIGGKIRGFSFKEDPTALLQKIQTGAIDFTRPDRQFPCTPPDLADQMVKMADIYPDDHVLEPSAGMGSLIKAIHRKHPDLVVDYCELSDPVALGIDRLPNTRFVARDFLSYLPDDGYHVIIAHPPLNRSQDIDHISYMFKLLRPGGRLVSIASMYWDIRDSKPKEQKFKHWLFSHGAKVELLDKYANKHKPHAMAYLISMDKPVK